MVKFILAEVAELADALGSGLSGFTPIGVQLPSSACETSMAEAHASAVRFTPSRLGWGD